MTNKQKRFIDFWLEFFNHDTEQIRHLLEKHGENWPIKNFTDSESKEIWESISLWCDAQ